MNREEQIKAASSKHLYEENKHLYHTPNKFGKLYTPPEMIPQRNTQFEAGAKWADNNPCWHIINEDGMPEIKKSRVKPKLFIVALEYLIDNETEYVTTVALLSNKETQEGIAYTPKGRFYWGPDIFDNAIAWMELPEFKPILI